MDDDTKGMMIVASFAILVNVLLGLAFVAAMVAVAKWIWNAA